MAVNHIPPCPRDDYVPRAHDAERRRGSVGEFFGMGRSQKLRQEWLLKEQPDQNDRKEQKRTERNNIFFAVFCFKRWKGAGCFVRPFRAYGFMGNGT